jgi:hypothetical protein
MSLSDYAKKRDRFEAQTDAFDDICFLCKHFSVKANQEPCRTCDHNANAVKDERTCASCDGGPECLDCERCDTCFGKSGWTKKGG